MLGILIAIVILVPAGLIVLLVTAAAIKAGPDGEAYHPAPGHWMGIGIGVGIPIGLFLGLVMGIAVENIPIGIALGPAMGVGVMTAPSSRKAFSQANSEAMAFLL